MENLIKALNILLKYGNPDYPTHCEHDTLYVCGIESKDVSEADISDLDKLGFFVNEEDGGFMSFHYGSA